MVRAGLMETENEKNEVLFDMSQFESVITDGDSMRLAIVIERIRNWFMRLVLAKETYLI